MVWECCISSCPALPQHLLGGLKGWVRYAFIQPIHSPCQGYEKAGVDFHLFSPSTAPAKGTKRLGSISIYSAHPQPLPRVRKGWGRFPSTPLIHSPCPRYEKTGVAFHVFSPSLATGKLFKSLDTISIHAADHHPVPYLIQRLR